MSFLIALYSQKPQGACQRVPGNKKALPAPSGLIEANSEATPLGLHGGDMWDRGKSGFVCPPSVPCPATWMPLEKWFFSYCLGNLLSWRNLLFCSILTLNF